MRPEMVVGLHVCLWLCLERNATSADWGKGQGSMTNTKWAPSPKHVQNMQAVAYIKAMIGFQ